MAIQLGRAQSSQQMVLGKLGVHVQNLGLHTMCVYIYISVHTKIKSKSIKNLNVGPKTIKALEETIGGKFHDIGLAGTS